MSKLKRFVQQIIRPSELADWDEESLAEDDIDDDEMMAESMAKFGNQVIIGWGSMTS